MKSNLELTKDVQNELKWETSLIDSEILVSADEGIVTLTGMVDSLLKKKSAENVAKQVAGVKDVTNKIKVKSVKQPDLTKSTFGDAENILSTTDDNSLKISGA